MKNKMDNVATNTKRLVILLSTAFVFVLTYVYFESGVNTRTSPPPLPVEILIQNYGNNPRSENDNGHYTRKVTNKGHQRYTSKKHNKVMNKSKRTSNWWESFASNDYEVKDQDSLASPSNSRMTLRYQKNRYFVGDFITVQINIKDNRGHPKTKGGDHIRVWARGTESRGVMGTVVDNGDGSYEGKIRILWAGNITIKARIAARREQLAFIFHTIKQGNTPKRLFGEFTNGSDSEKVRCTGSLLLSQQWDNACNLTNMNNGLPWFCHKPKRLPCTRWTFIKAEVMKSEIENITFPWVSDGELIPSGVNVLAETRQSGIGDPGVTTSSSSPDVTPCNEVPSRTTWKARTPVGYAHKGRWMSTFCSSKFNGSRQVLKTCLKGKRIWFIGDSTVRQLFSYMFQKLSLKMKTVTWDNPKWNRLSVAVDIEETIFLIFAVHGLPFDYAYRKTPVKSLNATHTYIDSIPAGANDIIMIHFYMHFQLKNPEVLRMTVRKTVSSLKRLKERAPNTTIVVKGPHSFGFVRYLSYGDFYGEIVMDIYRDEFKSIQDEVIYLDLWDLTIASESRGKHPNKFVVNTLMQYLLSFICP